MKILIYFLLLFQPYSKINCSGLVSFRHHPCTAAQIFDGCDSRLMPAQPGIGVVVAYNRAHVGIYVSKNFILDSTPEHGVMIHRVPQRDPWYTNPKYLVWK